MMVKSIATIMHGDDPLAAKAHPARRPLDLPDDEAFRHIQNGTMQPHGEAAQKRFDAMREEKARERIRQAQEWRGDDERDDEPVEDRAASDEQAKSLEEMHNREARNVAAVQKIAKGEKAEDGGGKGEKAKAKE